MSLSDRTQITKPIQFDLFYNTAHLKAKDLHQRRVVAAGQCRAILDFFKGNPRGYFTPFEVQLYTSMQHTPITSIHRAINTLTINGLIIKTEVMKEGEYGVNNHTWKLA
jgi:hypothetical protein